MDANLYPMGVFETCLYGFYSLGSIDYIFQFIILVFWIGVWFGVIYFLNDPFCLSLKNKVLQAFIVTLLTTMVFPTIPLCIGLYAVPTSHISAINDYFFDQDPSQTNAQKTKMADWRKQVCIQVKSTEGYYEEYEGRQLVASKDFLSILVQESGFKPRVITFPQSEVLKIECCPEEENPSGKT